MWAVYEIFGRSIAGCLPHIRVMCGLNVAYYFHTQISKASRWKAFSEIGFSSSIRWRNECLLINIFASLVEFHIHAYFILDWGREQMRIYVSDQRSMDYVFVAQNKQTNICILKAVSMMLKLLHQ